MPVPHLGPPPPPPALEPDGRSVGRRSALGVLLRMGLLGAAGAGLLGCSPRPGSGPPSGAATGPATPAAPLPSPDPDAAVRAAAAGAERELLDRYAATAARHPRLARDLSAAARNHAVHLAALTGQPTPPPRATGAPTGKGGARGPVDARPRAALAQLRAAEAAAAQARVRDCVRAADPELAALLAAIGAAEAAHASLLRAPA